MKYMQIIDEYLEDLDEEERLFYILEKPSPTPDKDKTGQNKVDSNGKIRIKDGIHIMAPGIVVNEYLQLKFREFVYKNCDDIFNFTFDNPYSDIFDRSVITQNGWMMYGSHKPKSSPYLLTGIYDLSKSTPEKIYNSTYYVKTNELCRLLSIQDFTMADAIG